MTLPYLLLSVFIVLTALPGAWLQLRRVHKAATAQGLSVGYIAIGTGSAATWFTYGITAHQPLQMIVNGSGVIAGVLTMVLIARLVPQSRPLLFGMGLYFALVAVVAILFGSAPLGFVGAASGILCRVPQAVRSWRTPGGQGVSVSAFTFTAISASGWLAFGAIRQDPFIIASSAATILVSMWVVYRTVAAPASATSHPWTESEDPVLLAS